MSLRPKISSTASANSTSPAPVAFSATPKVSSFSTPQFFLFFIAVLLLLLIAHSHLPTPIPAIPEFPPSLRTNRPLALSLNNCDLIHQLLRKDIPSNTEGLPAAGKSNEFGLVFWLKTPVLRTTSIAHLPEVVLLKYNKYLPTQHDLKYKNTVSILSEFSFHESQLFPKLFAYCDDGGDGFHYLLVEYIPLHVSELKKPLNGAECIHRARQLLQLLVVLDEDMHLAFMDVKKGQWMIRSPDLSFVFQDVDDMVRSPWVPTNQAGDLYLDQVDVAKRLLQENLPAGTPIGVVDKLWDQELFPQGYTIRYTMILLRFILVDDVGFRWEQYQKNLPEGFLPCFYKLLQWAATPENDWPSPKQVLLALNECEIRGEFDKSLRVPASWRDFPPTSNSDHKRYISCIRNRDSLKKTDAKYTENVQWCDMEKGNQSMVNSKTCCRAKGSQPCYYWADSKLCKGL